METVWCKTRTPEKIDTDKKKPTNAIRKDSGVYIWTNLFRHHRLWKTMKSIGMGGTQNSWKCFGKYSNRLTRKITESTGIRRRETKYNHVGRYSLDHVWSRALPR